MSRAWQGARKSPGDGSPWQKSPFSTLPPPPRSLPPPHVPGTDNPLSLRTRLRWLVTGLGLRGLVSSISYNHPSLVPKQNRNAVFAPKSSAEYFEKSNTVTNFWIHFIPAVPHQTDWSVRLTGPTGVAGSCCLFNLHRFGQALSFFPVPLGAGGSQIKQCGQCLSLSLSPILSLVCSFPLLPQHWLSKYRSHPNSPSLPLHRCPEPLMWSGAALGASWEPEDGVAGHVGNEGGRQSTTQSASLPFASNHPRGHHVYTYEVTHPLRWALSQIILDYRMFWTHCWLFVAWLLKILIPGRPSTW